MIDLFIIVYLIIGFIASIVYLFYIVLNDKEIPYKKYDQYYNKYDHDESFDFIFNIICCIIIVMYWPIFITISFAYNRYLSSKWR
jgi:uncharacterized membrane protein SpoIIM required for sporulation